MIDSLKITQDHHGTIYFEVINSKGLADRLALPVAEIMRSPAMAKELTNGIANTLSMMACYSKSDSHIISKMTNHDGKIYWMGWENVGLGKRSWTNDREQAEVFPSADSALLEIRSHKLSNTSDPVSIEKF